MTPHGFLRRKTDEPRDASPRPNTKDVASKLSAGTAPSGPKAEQVKVTRAFGRVSVEK